MTNKLKTVFPGDFYKLWVDIASVFYDFAWPSRELGVKAFSEAGAVVRDFRRRLLLLAIGASGNRQYGSNKAILPDENNVCAVSQMPLFRKLAVKGPLQNGGHQGLPRGRPLHRREDSSSITRTASSSRPTARSRASRRRTSRSRSSSCPRRICASPGYEKDLPVDSDHDCGSAHRVRLRVGRSQSAHPYRLPRRPVRTERRRRTMGDQRNRARHRRGERRWRTARRAEASIDQIR